MKKIVYILVRDHFALKESNELTLHEGMHFDLEILWQLAIIDALRIISLSMLNMVVVVI
jgi:hypothetical protein